MDFCCRACRLLFRDVFHSEGKHEPPDLSCASCHSCDRDHHHRRSDNCVPEKESANTTINQEWYCSDTSWISIRIGTRNSSSWHNVENIVTQLEKIIHTTGSKIFLNLFKICLFSNSEPKLNRNFLFSDGI